MKYRFEFSIKMISNGFILLSKKWLKKWKGIFFHEMASYQDLGCYLERVSLNTRAYKSAINHIKKTFLNYPQIMNEFVINLVRYEDFS